MPRREADASPEAPRIVLIRYCVAHAKQWTEILKLARYRR